MAKKLTSKQKNRDKQSAKRAERLLRDLIIRDHKRRKGKNTK